MYNNLPQLGPPLRRPPYRRYPKPPQLGDWFSDVVGHMFPKSVDKYVERNIEDIMEKPLIPALLAGTLLIPVGGVSLLSRIGSFMYTAPIASGTGVGTTATGLLPTVFGVGVPGAGLVGKAATSIGGLLYTPAIASGVGAGTVPTGLLTTVFGLGVPGAGLIGKVGTVVAGALIPKTFAPGTDVTQQPGYTPTTRAGIVPGIANTDLAIMAGGAAVLLLLLSGRRK